MKFRHKLLCFFTFAFFSGCYTVNERDSLSIVFNDSKLAPGFIKTYIDSVRNKNFVIPDSIKEIFFVGDSIRWDESLVYFNNAPKEWYLVRFSSAPGSIESIYNPELSIAPIIRKTDLTEEKIRQIEVRYRKEILDSVILYGKKRHLPDSVVFNTKIERPPYNQ
ncbi:MAG: hypothetical protein ABI113_21730 [Mucilaginibacter sp.]